MSPFYRVSSTTPRFDTPCFEGTPSRAPSSALSHPFLGWEGSPTKIDCRKKGTLILTSSLSEDLALFSVLFKGEPKGKPEPILGVSSPTLFT